MDRHLKERLARARAAHAARDQQPPEPPIELPPVSEKIKNHFEERRGWVKDGNIYVKRYD